MQTIRNYIGKKFCQAAPYVHTETQVLHSQHSMVNFPRFYLAYTNYFCAITSRGKELPLKRICGASAECSFSFFWAKKHVQNRSNIPFTLIDWQAGVHFNVTFKLLDLQT